MVDVLFWHLLNSQSNSVPSFSTKSRSGAQEQSQLMAVVRGASENSVELYGYNAQLKPTGKLVKLSISENLPLFRVADCLLKAKMILFFGHDEKIEMVMTI